MPSMKASFMEFDCKGAPEVGAGAQMHPGIWVVEIWGTFVLHYYVINAEFKATGRREIEIPVDELSFSAALVRNGFIGTSPEHPNTAIAINVLELFRNLSVRCPTLSIQAFVRSLSEMHKVRYLLFIDINI